MSDVKTRHDEEPIIRLGISTCLLGEDVRFDGGYRQDLFLLKTLGRYVEMGPRLSRSGDWPRHPSREPASGR